jgi:hypothetical protein
MSANARASGKKKAEKGKSIAKVKDLPAGKKAASIRGGVAAAEPGDTPVIIGLNKRT